MPETHAGKEDFNNGTHDPHVLIDIFNGSFKQRYQTVLVKGHGEPLYLPKCADNPYHRIYFAHGYFSSALHEVAHWCIAGKRRRRLVDYGYWYKPDGRNAAEQKAFERVEVKPQALEWIFSAACPHPFHFSTDNLRGESGDIAAFQKKVRCQATSYLRHGMPPRAQRFLQALAAFFGTAPDLDLDRVVTRETK